MTLTRRRLLAAGSAGLLGPLLAPAAAWPASSGRTGVGSATDPAVPDILAPPTQPATGGIGVDERSPSIDPPFVGEPAEMYGPRFDEPHPVKGLKLSVLRPPFVRQMVPYDTGEPAGTIVIDPSAHFLHLVQGDGTAVRYGVGVGRSGFGWSGEAMIHDKRVWPDWYPPAEMLERQPELMAKMQVLQSGTGMAGGPGNPLGARALYLWQGRKDTLFRVHGTVEPWTIGRSVSSGCIRMVNQDVIDLYDRVPVGTRVVVLGPSRSRRARASGAL